MDQEVKQRWVEALRSGEYEQGQGKLGRHWEGNEKAQYCCLGVLCEIADEATTWVDHDEGGYKYMVTEKGSMAYPSYSLTARVDLPGRFGEFPREVEDLIGNTLADLNDAGFTFSQIADLIEWAF